MCCVLSGGSSNVRLRLLQTVTKPFASIFPAELASREELRGFNFLTGSIDTASRVGLISRVVAKAYGSPEVVAQLYSLYGGEGYNIVRSPTTGSLSSARDAPLSPPIDLDTSRIDKIVTFNAFTPSTHLPFISKPVGRSAAETPSALYLVPSLYNHDCASNADWHCFGDVMVVRANQDIDEGTEITIPYCAGSLQERSKALRTHFQDRQCACDLCRWDRADEADEARRADVHNRWASSKKGGSRESLDRNLIQYVRNIESTYRTSDSLPHNPRTVHPAAFHAHSVAAVHYMARYSQEEVPDACRQAAEHWFKALKAAGFTGIDSSTNPKLPLSTSKILPISRERVPSATVGRTEVIESLVNLSLCFIILEDRVRAVRWLRSAWFGESFGRGTIRHQIATEARFLTVTEVTYGGGQDMFDAILKKSPNYSTITAHFASLNYGWD